LPGIHQFSCDGALARRLKELELKQELSLSSVANDIAPTYHGMMIASPEDAWRFFSFTDAERPPDNATFHHSCEKLSVFQDKMTFYFQKYAKPESVPVTTIP
jgi:hypothetical protein